MNAPCNACLMGPSGVMGHADLMARTLGDTRISLQCRRCDTFWARAQGREGFVWTGMSGEAAFKPGMGTILPTGTGTNNLRPWPGRNGSFSFFGSDEPRARRAVKIRFREPVRGKTSTH